MSAICYPFCTSSDIHYWIKLMHWLMNKGHNINIIATIILSFDDEFLAIQVLTGGSQMTKTIERLWKISLNVLIVAHFLIDYLFPSFMDFLQFVCGIWPQKSNRGVIYYHLNRRWWCNKFVKWVFFFKMIFGIMIFLENL